MDNKPALNDYNYSISDSNNLLLILYHEIIFIYDGEKWGQIYINDINMPVTDFKLLKRPGFVEISPNIIGKEYIKSFLVLGGFNPESKICGKTVYSLNFKKNKQFNELSKTEMITYDCLLDFKFGDMNTSRYLNASINIEDKFVLLIGGKNEKGWLNSCEYLNLSTGKWEDFAALKSARTNFDCCYFIEQKNNTKTIYAYGGYSGPNVFPDNLIEYCNVEIIGGKLKETEWKNLKIVAENKSSLPKICARLIKFYENILIVGGSDGKHMLNDIFELDPNDGSITKLGELDTARNNFHILLQDEYIHLVGGSAYKYDRNDSMIENYVEKLTFDLNNRIESCPVSVLNEVFLFPITNMAIDESEFLQEPGFPYSTSSMTKKFN